MNNNTMAAANANNNNTILNNNAYTNREMYNKSRTGWSEGTPAFHTSNLEDFDGKMTFAKATNGSIASIYSWYDNTATYYEKIDGKWYEIDAERTKQIQDALWAKYCQQVKAETSETDETDNKVSQILFDLAIQQHQTDDEVIDNFVNYIDNTTICDSERLRIIEFLQYDSHNRLSMVIDSRDDRAPFAAIGKYYENLYRKNGMDSSSDDCVRFRNKLKDRLNNVAKLRSYA